MNQAATIYAREDELLVCSYSHTTDGFPVMNGTIVRLPGDADDERLAAAIVRALGASAEGVPDPPLTGGSPFGPLLSELGLRTYGHFMKGAEAVRVSGDASGLVVTPMHNGGARNGFTAIDEIAETLPGGDPAAVAGAVRRGLSDAF